MPFIAAAIGISTALSFCMFLPILFSGMPIQPNHWKCTQSIITRIELPKEEMCVQWTKNEKTKP